MVSKHFDDIKIKFKEESDNKLTLVAEPFERGYGVTVGNALRRTLMTSVPGAAIVSVKIVSSLNNWAFILSSIAISKEVVS